MGSLSQRSSIVDLNMHAKESVWSLGLARATHLDRIQDGISIDPLFPLQKLHAFDGFAAADPFAMQVDGTWYVFFEMLRRSASAVIAVASSRDLTHWEMLGVCLAAPHHLSFPFVFEHGGERYMMPESKSARRVDLYRAIEFPMRWERCATLIRGRYMDATLIEQSGRFWMHAGWHSYWLCLFSAPHPLGPWRRHWLPFARLYNKSNVRPAGRPIQVDGKWIRFVQDNHQGYGKQVQALEITCMNSWWYSERPWLDRPILAPAGEGWRKERMHHIDPHGLGHEWLAWVDGCN